MLEKITADNGVRSLRIVMLTTVRFHQSRGGTEKVMIDLANAMTRRGHQVTIIYRDKKGNTPGFPLLPDVKKVNCATVNTPWFLGGFFRNMRAFGLSEDERQKKVAFLKLKALKSRFDQAIRENPCDVYVTYEPKLSAMLVKEYGIKNKTITTIVFSS